MNTHISHPGLAFFKKKYALFIYLFLLFVFSCILVFFRFPSLPQGLAFDEVENGNLALRLAHQSYTPYTEYATGHATFYYYLILASLKLFGVTTFALRLPSALAGIGAVLVFFLLMRQVFQKHPFLPVVLSVLFITTRWYYNFVRFSFQGPFLIFLELSSLVFLLIFIRGIPIVDEFAKQTSRMVGNVYPSQYIWERAAPDIRILDQVRYNNKVHLILSGVFAGLAFNSYQPGRIFFLIPFIFLCVYAIKKIGKTFFKQKQFYVLILYFLIPFLIIIVPLTSYLATHQDVRIEQQLYFADSELSWGEKMGYLFENMGKTMQMFHIQGDLNGRHNYPGKPALNIIAGILFFIGIIRASIQYRSSYNLLFFAYFFLSLIPTLFTYPSENPHMLRTITTIPAVIYFCGLALQLGYDIIISRIKIPERYAYIIIIGIIGVSALYDLRTYFVYQTEVFPEAFPIHMPLDEAVSSK